MKRILIYFFLLFSISAGAQTTTTTQWQGAPLTKVINRGVFQVDSAFLNARRDTTFTPTQTGIQVFREADLSLYVSIALTGKKWEKIGAAGSGGAWGTITGTLSSQTDLQAALDAKQDTITTGSTAQYFKGNLSLGTFSTDVRSVGDAAYSQLGHTHTSAQVTDFTEEVRSLFSAGTGLSYNSTTGQFSFSGGGAGTYLFSAPLNESGGTVSITQANGSTNGYLSAVDWTLFNGKVSQDALDDTAAALRALIAAATPDSFTYATRRYVDSSVSALSGDFINNSTAQQTANFNITGNGVMGGNLDVTGSGNFAQNRAQLYHATLGGGARWYNTSGDLYSEVNPDQGGYMSSRRFVFNMAVGDPTAGTDYKGYLYMKAGAPWWSYNGTHTAIPLGGGGASTTSDLTDVSDAAPANNTVLTYNQDSGKYVPTQVAAFNFTDLQDGQYLSYDSLNNEWVNVDAPTGGGGSGSIDSIQEVSSIASAPGGNIMIYEGYLWNRDNRNYSKWRRSDGLDSVTFSAPGTEWTNIAPWDNANYVNASNVWTVGSGGIAGYGNLAKSATTITGDGGVRMKKTASDAVDAVMGFNTSNATTGIGSMPFAFWFANDGKVYVRESGTNVYNGAISIGDWVRAYRSGSTWTIDRSADGTTWVNLYTSAGFTHAGVAYIVSDFNKETGKQYDPEYLD